MVSIHTVFKDDYLFPDIHGLCPFHNAIGVGSRPVFNKGSYKICTIFSIAFRYIPDIGRDYENIKISMQARGVELDPKKVPLMDRIKQNVLILVPLIISSFERVGNISNAMDLRGYGRGKTRTYYCEHEEGEADKIFKAIYTGLLLFCAFWIVSRIIYPPSKMWYPFHEYEFKDYHGDLIRSVSELIRIPTVFDEATVTKGMPYGKKVYEGYVWLKAKAQNDGFEVKEYDGHALAVRIPGNPASERIDVVSHLDVVEPGTGWENDPFSGAVMDGHVHGRGAQDMKGPLIATYYALKYIKDNRIPCNRELRIVIGCDEERTMDDMRYYLDKAKEPIFAFTPDGKFPYSYGEKGALMWTMDQKVRTSIRELDGGVQCNVVSPMATAFLDGTGI